MNAPIAEHIQDTIAEPAQSERQSAMTEPGSALAPKQTRPYAQGIALYLTLAMAAILLAGLALS